MDKNYCDYQQELDNFLKENKTKFFVRGYWTGDFVNLLLSKYMNLADSYCNKGEEELGRQVMRSAEYIFIDYPYLNESNNIDDSLFDSLTGKMSIWMIEHGMKNEIRPLYESALLSAKMVLFRHYDNRAMRRLKNALMVIYDDEGELERKNEILTQLFETTFWGYINELSSISWGAVYTRDLSYVRVLFRELMKSLKNYNDVCGGVSLLNKWVFLCDRYYVDDKDIGDAYDDYYLAYAYLASLYDGTTTLIDALKIYNSPFLKDPYILIAKDGLYGYMDKDGTIVVPCKYRSARKATSKDILAVMGDNNKWLYIDTNGEPLFNGLTFDYAFPPRDGYLVCGKNQQDFIVNITTKTFQQISTKIQISEIGFISQGLLKFCFDVETGINEDVINALLNQSSNSAISSDENEGVLFSDINSNRLRNYLKQDGKTILLPIETEVVKSANRGVIVAGSYNEDGDLMYGLYDLNGTVIVQKGCYDTMLPFGENELTPVSKDSLYGFINRSGNVIVPLKYSDARRFSCGLAAVRDHDGLWGFINEDGKELKPCSYGAVSDFCENRAWVRRPNNHIYNSSKSNISRFGYIDNNGKEIVPLEYEDVTIFYEGKAQIRKGDIWRTIDKNGIFLDK